MKLGKTGRQFALQSGMYRQLEVFFALLHFVLGWFVVSVVVFLRKDFGERFLSSVNLFFAYMAIGLFTGLGGAAISYFAHESASQLMPLLVLGFIGASIYHRLEIRKKVTAGKRWHTQYSGTPLLKKINHHGSPLLKRLVKCSNETLNKWIEPGVVLLAAYLLRRLHSTPTALWLFISGLALLLHEHISYYLQRVDFWDRMDAMIEAQYWQAAMEGKPVEETAGFYIAESNRELLTAWPEMPKDVFANLDPELRDMMNANDDGSTGVRA